MAVQLHVLVPELYAVWHHKLEQLHLLSVASAPFPLLCMCCQHAGNCHFRILVLSSCVHPSLTAVAANTEPTANELFRRAGGR